MLHMHKNYYKAWAVFLVTSQQAVPNLFQVFLHIFFTNCTCGITSGAIYSLQSDATLADPAHLSS